MSDRGFTEGVRIVNGTRFLDTPDGLLIEPDNIALINFIIYLSVSSCSRA